MDTGRGRRFAGTPDKSPISPANDSAGNEVLTTSMLGNSGRKSTSPSRPSEAHYVLVRKQKRNVGGVYGIGLKVDKMAPHVVQRVSGLKDKDGLAINRKVRIGDVLDAVEGRRIKQGGWNAIEELIFGPAESTVALTFAPQDRSARYTVHVKRHVPIRVWDEMHSWLELREDLKGQDLLAEAGVVEELEGVRLAVTDKTGKTVDLLKDNKHHNCCLGFVLAAEMNDTGMEAQQIYAIIPGSPAWMSGTLQTGDFVEAVDGVKADENNVVKLIEGSDIIGSTCSLTISRNEKTFHVELYRSLVSTVENVETVFNLLEQIDRQIEEEEPHHAILQTSQTLSKLICDWECNRCEKERVLAHRLQTVQESIVQRVDKAEGMLHAMEDTTTLLRKIRDLQLQVDSSQAERDDALRRVNDMHRSQPLAANLSTASPPPRSDLERELEATKAKNTQLQKELLDADETNLSLRKEVSKFKKDRGDEGSLTSRSFESSASVDGSDGMVPKAQLDEARRVNRELLSDMEKLKRAMEAMVLKADLDISQAKVADLTEQVKALLEQLEKAKKENVDLEGLDSENSQQMTKLRLELQKLRIQLQGTVPRSELLECQGELKSCQEALAEKTKEAAVHKTTIDELRKELEELRRKLTGAESKVSRSDLDRATAEAKASKESAAETAARLAKAEKEVSELKRQLKAVDEVRERLEGQVSGMVPRRELLEAQAKRKEAEDKAEAKKKDVEIVEGHNAELRKDSQTLRRDIEKLRTEVSEARGNAAASKEEAAEKAKAAEQLDAQAKRLKQELEALKGEMKGMVSKADLARVTAEAQSNKRHADDVSERLAKVEREAEGLRKQVKALEGDKEKLTEEVTKTTADAAASKRHAKELTELLSKAEKELADLKTQLKSVRMEKEKLEETMAGMAPRQELLAAQSELKATKDIVSAKAREVEMLQGHNNSLRNDIQALKAEMEKLRSEAADAKGMAETRKGELVEVKKKLQALEREKERLEGDIAGMVARKDLLESQARVREAQEVANAKGKETEMLNGHNAELRNEAQSLRKELERLRSELAGAKGDMAAWKEEAEQKTKAVTSLEAQVRKLKEEVEKMRADMKGTVPRGDFIQATGETQASQKTAKEAADKLAKAEKELEEMRKRMQAVTADKERLEAAMQGMVPRRELIDCQTKLKEAQDTAEAKKKEADVHRRQCADLQQEIAKLKQEIERLTSELTGTKGDLAERLSRADKENTELKKQMKALQADKDRLEAMVAGMVPRKDLTDCQTKLKEAQDAADSFRKDAMAKAQRGAALEAQVRASAEEIESLREQMKLMVSRADLARVSTDAENEHGRAAQLADRLMQAEQAVADLSRQVKASEAGRLRAESALQNMVPRGEWEAARADAKSAAELAEARRRELELLDRGATELREEVQRLRRELDKQRAELDGTKFATRTSWEERAAADNKLQRMADALQTSVSSLESSVPRLAPKAQLTASQHTVGQLEKALSDLRNMLAAANLSNPLAFKAIAEALRGPGAVSPMDAARLIEQARGLDSTGLNELLSMLAQARTMKPPVLPGGLKRLMLILQTPSRVSFDESCTMLELLRADNISAEQLQYLLRLRVHTAIIADVERLHREGFSVQDLEQQLEMLRKKACPAPEEHEELRLLREEVAVKRTVRKAEPVAVRAAAPPPPPPEPPKPAGIGLLLERIDGENDIHVKSLTRGGSAEQDGRIRALDVILSVDGVEVTGMPLDEVFKMVLGTEGTEVRLHMQRVILRTPRKAASPYSSYSSDHKETSTFFVTLTRKYMDAMPNLGQIEVSPPRERPGLISREHSPALKQHSTSLSPGPMAQYTSLPRTLATSRTPQSRSPEPQFASRPPTRVPKSSQM